MQVTMEIYKLCHFCYNKSAWKRVLFSI